MHRVFRPSLLFVFLALIAGSLHADELGVVSINPDDSLSIALHDTATSTSTSVSSNFGHTGDHIVLGRLVSADAIHAGTIEPGPAGAEATWRIVDRAGNPAGELAFGTGSSVFVSGADFDGDGIIDPAIIDLVGKSLRWTIRPGAFSASPGAVVTRTFGAKSDRSRAFFANIDGVRDRLGTTRKLPGFPAAKPRYQLRLVDVQTGKVRTRVINSIGEISGRPLPVKRANGADLLAFVRTNSSGVRAAIITSNGRRLTTKTFSGEGTVVVGDFATDDPGEELGYYSETTLTTFNPVSRITRTLTVPAGIPVDAININAFAGSPSGPLACGGTPGVCGCNFLDETDGYKIGFVYKARSDTYGGIVAVLPNPCGRGTTGVSVLDQSCAVVDTLDDNGYGNPDGTGVRHHFKKRDGSRVGRYYQQQYGSIIFRLDGTDACIRIENPAQPRVD